MRSNAAARSTLSTLRRGMLDVVDLRPLELAGVVDVDGLPLREDIERRLAGLAVAVARVLRAAEGEVDLRAGRARIDVRDPGLQIAHRAEGLVHVAREDRGREAVADPVRDPDRLVEALDRDQCSRRPEDLLLRDPHLRVDVREDRRPVEEPLPEVALVHLLATREELGALVRADAGVGMDLVEGLAVDHRAEIGLGIPARADLHLLRTGDEPLLQLAIDGLVDDHAARGGAALARRTEPRP